MFLYCTLNTLASLKCRSVVRGKCFSSFQKDSRGIKPTFVHLKGLLYTICIHFHSASAKKEMRCQNINNGSWIFFTHFNFQLLFIWWEFSSVTQTLLWFIGSCKKLKVDLTLSSQKVAPSTTLLCPQPGKSANFSFQSPTSLKRREKEGEPVERKQSKLFNFQLLN